MDDEEWKAFGLVFAILVLLGWYLTWGVCAILYGLAICG
jgi:hypothetical protein